MVPCIREDELTTGGSTSVTEEELGMTWEEEAVDFLLSLVIPLGYNEDGFWKAWPELGSLGVPFENAPLTQESI